jgi:hypothetical protein
MSVSLIVKQSNPVTVILKGSSTTLTVRGPSPNLLTFRSDSVVPLATTTTAGAVIVGANLTISANGVLSASGGAGATALSQLSDVQLSSLTQGDLLSYNQSISKWANIKQSVVTDGGNF